MIETMTLKEMATYTGAQEPPRDLSEFWDKQKRECSKQLEYTLDEKDFELNFAKFYELTFEGTNGSSVYSRCIFPKGGDKYPTIFSFHGYQGQSPDWTENLKYVAAGYGVVCMDVRGQAGKSSDHGIFDGNTVKGQVIRGLTMGPNHLFFKDVYLDVFQLVNLVSTLSFVDEEKLFSLGASQGGALALVAAALNSKIKKVISVYPFLSDFKRVLELGNNSEPYDELFRYFKFTDPLHETEEKVLRTLSYIDVKNLAQFINCPVTMITGLEDVVCPPSTQFAIYNRLKNPADHKILPEYGHEALNVKVNDYIYDQIMGSKIVS